MPTPKKETWNELYSRASELYGGGTDHEKIRLQLLEMHADEALVYAVIRKVKSDHYAEKRKEGLIILAVGAVFILAGFIITCCNFHSNQSFSFAMYGLTSIGIIIVFWGLYKIIG